MNPNSSLETIKLILIGSCRNQEDQDRVDSLKQLAKSLDVESQVEFKLNFTFDNLLKDLAASAVGIHSMVDEHFGIGVVECMAAGTVMLAHNSAGPKMDIVVPSSGGNQTGFLARTDEEFAECLYTIYAMSVEKRNLIREKARVHVKKFSQEQFDVEFIAAFNTFCYNRFILNKTKRE